MKPRVHLIAWNALFLVAGLVLVATTGEVYLKLTRPFMSSEDSVVFVPDVGVLYKPRTEIRATNRLDFWTVSKANSYGFVDYEPLSPAEAAAGCHIAVIGDSFVEARHVPMSAKLHIRLQELAGQHRRLAGMNVTTSAWARKNTAQASQLPFYDKYVRWLRPKLLVLVFHNNDLGGNSAAVMAARQGWQRDKMPFAFPWTDKVDGTIKLRMPTRDFLLSLSLSTDIRRSSLACRLGEGLLARSYFLGWATAKVNSRRNVQVCQVLPSSVSQDDYEEALALTAWALDQFKQRANRDGASLILLATHAMGSVGDDGWETLAPIAAEHGIPVVSQAEYILRQGATTSEAQFDHDGHWNPLGHRWAAEAVLSYIEQRLEICAAA